MLPKAGIVTQGLWIDATDDPLGIGNQTVELLAGADIQVAEPLEELGEVLDTRIPEDLGLSIIVPGESLGEMRDQFGEFCGEGFLRQTNGLVETGLHALTLFS